MKPSLIITRPKDKALALSETLRATFGGDVEIILSPVLRILPLPMAQQEPVDHYIFTSRTGVAQFARLGLPSAPAWCVGDQTAEDARSAGLEAVSASGTIEDLKQLILERRPEGRLLHLSGKHVRGDLVQVLVKNGLSAKRVAVYDQLLCSLNDIARARLEQDTHVIAPLFSPRSVQAFLAPARRASLHVVAISSTTADAAHAANPETLDIARTPNEQSMIEAIENRAQKLLDLGA